jgi:hypothetical protein
VANTTTYIHINVSRYDYVQKHRRTCPTCKKRTTFLHLGQAWYGTSATCMECGDSWSEEGRAERPFMPKWRERSIASAKRIWKQYGPVDTILSDLEDGIA